MKRLGTLFVAVVLVGLLAPRAHAQGTNAWAAGYPKTGNNNGEILIKGKATLDAGWRLTGSGLAVAWKVGGGPLIQKPITVNADGTWGEIAFGGLESGKMYNVVVQANVTNGLATESVGTDPEQAKAK